jgi:hypothetical protein
MKMTNKFIYCVLIEYSIKYILDGAERETRYLHKIKATGNDPYQAAKNALEILFIIEPKQCDFKNITLKGVEMEGEFKRSEALFSCIYSEFNSQLNKMAEDGRGGLFVNIYA